MIFMHAERETMVQGEYGYIVIVQNDENGDELKTLTAILDAVTSGSGQ